jgi:hypothetical protein
MFEKLRKKFFPSYASGGIVPADAVRGIGDRMAGRAPRVDVAVHPVIRDQPPCPPGGPPTRSHARDGGYAAYPGKGAAPAPTREPAPTLADIMRPEPLDDRIRRIVQVEMRKQLAPDSVLSRELGKRMAGIVREVLKQEVRPGGLLDRPSERPEPQSGTRGA